ncbi:glycosyltransferase [Christiangramia aquimixticola]|uniref:glycosyltransferase n=1 Tax=Christiangramia aquimixticola TaxID=1697558 RepID=UPI003AA968EB
MKENLLFNTPPEYENVGRLLSENGEHLRVVVTIPAKNEELTIWNTLNALAHQQTKAGNLPTNLYEILILCNHCTDQTVNLCAEFQDKHPDLPLYIFKTDDPKINSVGASRKLLMDLASARLPENGFIAMTDADTVCDNYWLDAFLKLQEQPYDLICGVIKPELTGLDKRVKDGIDQTRHYLDLVSRLESELYPLEFDPWPRHSHNSGPNMAVRNKVYKAIGGIPPLDCFEDIALYQKVISEGYSVKHAFSPIVTTSCRSKSRVPGGFGSQIRNWSRSKSETVEGFSKLSQRFKAFAEIREYYRNPSLRLFNSICSRLYISSKDLEDLIEKHQKHTALIIYLENNLKEHGPWNIAYPDVIITRAIDELKNYFASFSQTTKSYSSSR